MTKEIELTRGKVAIVDDEDFDLVSRYKWHAFPGCSGLFYAARTKWIRKGKFKKIMMHRLVTSPEDGMEIDHIDGNGLNNCKSNLRTCTSAQNKMNSKKSTGTSSKYKGVCWDKNSNRWVSQLGFNKKNLWLGRFDREIDAAIAYDDAAIKHFGEFARLNFPEGDNG